MLVSAAQLEPVIGAIMTPARVGNSSAPLARVGPAPIQTCQAMVAALWGAIRFRKGPRIGAKSL